MSKMHAAIILALCLALPLNAGIKKNAYIFIEGKKIAVDLETDVFNDPVSFRIRKPTTIDGVEHRKGESIAWSDKFETLDERRQKSAKPIVANGISFASDVMIHANTDNIPWHGTLAANTEIQGIMFRGGKNIIFHKNGKVKLGAVAVGMELEGRTILAKHQIALDEQGRLADFHMVPEAEGLDRDFVLFRPNTLKTYTGKDNDGRELIFFQSGVLAKDSELTHYSGKADGKGWKVLFAAETELVAVNAADRAKKIFGIKKGTLAKEAKIDKKTYAAGKTLHFVNGKVVKVE